MYMKKIGFLLAAIMVFSIAQAQVITDKTSKKITVGFDIFTDVWLNQPEDMKTRTINQGFNVFATYNFPLGESPHTFSIGTGIRTHNLYSNNLIADIHADTIKFVTISESYKRSKVNLVYLDFPMEFRFRFDNKWKAGIGFKLGIEMDSKTKYLGKISSGGPDVKVKLKDINQLEKYTFGPTLRLGYRWINLFAYYQIPGVFERDLGPELTPFSVGVTISSF
jgi:hypothetical protein